MFKIRSHFAITASLLFTVFLWGGNNTAMKYLVKSWPPLWMGSTRLLCAGLLMFALLRWTNLLGKASPPSPKLKRSMLWRAGLGMAIYVAIFNWALHFTAASHVALYLGASPVWALLLEGFAGQRRGKLFQSFGAAGLALVGVVILLWPTLHAKDGTWPGELLGLAASVVWVIYSRQCRALGEHLSGAEISAHTMWRTGLLLLPLALIETHGGFVLWEPKLLLAQLYSIVAGGVIAFALWNNALRYWKASEVMLFVNLIPASTMLWVYFCLNEPMTSTFWIAMAFIAGGVIIGQANWQKLLGNRWMPTE